MSYLPKVLLFFFLRSNNIGDCFLNVSGYALNLLDKENAVETAKILETIDYLWNRGKWLISFILLC